MCGAATNVSIADALSVYHSLGCKAERGDTSPRCIFANSVRALGRNKYRLVNEDEAGVFPRWVLKSLYPY